MYENGYFNLQSFHFICFFHLTETNYDEATMQQQKEIENEVRQKGNYNSRLLINGLAFEDKPSQLICSLFKLELCEVPPHL